MKVELDLFNYPEKTDLKGATYIYTSMLTSKTHLASSKRILDNLDVDKLKIAPADLSKLSNVVDNNVVRKAVYDNLVTEVNAIDTKTPTTIGLVTKTQCDSDKKDLERVIENVVKKIPNTSALVKKSDNNTKVTEVENKIPGITNKVTTAAVNVKATEIEKKYLIFLFLRHKALNTEVAEVEGKIPDITNIATKAVLNTKHTEIERKIPQTFLLPLSSIDQQK